MSHFYKRIGERIKNHRLQKGYTIEELAVLIDVDDVMIEKIEQGRQRIFVDNISKLAMIFGVTTDYLIYGVDKSNE